MRRFVGPGGGLVYRLDLPRIALCRLEMILGNGYEVDVSSNGRTWRRAASATDPAGGSGKLAPDAAIIRMADAGDEAARGRGVYVRVSGSAADRFGGRPAFVQRIAVYGALRCDEAWVRISNARPSAHGSFTVERMTLRTWR
jgi:hypothetical protein